MNLTTSTKPIPNYGVQTVGTVAPNTKVFDGGQVTIAGTYLHHEQSLYDDSSIVTSMIPGPIAGAAALKVDGLTDDFIAKLTPDAVAGTDEKWATVTFTGTVDASNGAATLHVTDAQLREPKPSGGGAADDFGGFIDDEVVGTVGA